MISSTCCLIFVALISHVAASNAKAAEPTGNAEPTPDQLNQIMALFQSPGQQKATLAEQVDQVTKLLGDDGAPNSQVDRSTVNQNINEAGAGLHKELKSLMEDDRVRSHRLSENVKLRHQLSKQLQDVMDKFQASNIRLSEHLDSITSTATTKNGHNGEAFVQAGSDDVMPSSDQLEASFEQGSNALNLQIEELRASDASEVAGLHQNAVRRRALKNLISSQQEELMRDTTESLGELSRAVSPEGDVITVAKPNSGKIVRNRNRNRKSKSKLVVEDNA